MAVFKKFWYFKRYDLGTVFYVNKHRFHQSDFKIWHSNQIKLVIIKETDAQLCKEFMWQKKLVKSELENYLSKYVLGKKIVKSKEKAARWYKIRDRKKLIKLHENYLGKYLPPNQRKRPSSKSLSAERCKKIEFFSHPHSHQYVLTHYFFLTFIFTSFF